MERFACGDALAFEVLYDALVRPLYGHARSLTRNDDRASDLVQQTFMRICEKRCTFVPGSLVTPWAHAILRNLVRDQARRKRVEVPDDDGTPDSASDAPDPEECTSKREFREQLRRKCELLTPEQIEAIELVVYSQMSHAEAAEVLDVTVATITLRIQRAMQTLRATFREENPQ
jgi:RNA polymerase sigma-70 factor (ECF subfamily)